MTVNRTTAGRCAVWGAWCEVRSLLVAAPVCTQYARKRVGVAFKVSRSLLSRVTRAALNLRMKAFPFALRPLVFPKHKKTMF